MPRGPRPAPDPADTRDAILRAALELMSARSYDGTAVPDVASRAGFAAGTLYRHFTGKADLVNAVYRECKHSMHGTLAEATGGGESVRDGVHRLWRGLWEFSRKRPEAFRFLEMHRHQPYLDAESRDTARKVFDVVAEFVRDAQRAGELRAAPPEMLAALVFGAFAGLVKEAEAGHAHLDESRVGAAEEAVWGMLRP